MQANLIYVQVNIIETHEDNHDVLGYDNLVHVKTFMVRTHVGQKAAIQFKHV